MAGKKTSCAERLRVIGTDVRLEVLRQLGAGPKRVGELLALLQIEQSLLSHHLRVLRQHGLVRAERSGNAVRYRLAGRRGTTRVIDVGCCTVRFE